MSIPPPPFMFVREPEQGHIENMSRPGLRVFADHMTWPGKNTVRPCGQENLVALIWNNSGYVENKQYALHGSPMLVL